MKHTELEDGDQLVTRIELREVVLSLHEEIALIHQDMLEIKKEISDIRETIRTKWWIPIVVAIAAMIANSVATIVAAIILHHS